MKGSKTTEIGCQDARGRFGNPNSELPTTSSTTRLGAAGRGSGCALQTAGSPSVPRFVERCVMPYLYGYSTLLEEECASGSCWRLLLVPRATLMAAPKRAMTMSMAAQFLKSNHPGITTDPRTAEWRRVDRDVEASPLSPARRAAERRRDRWESEARADGSRRGSRARREPRYRGVRPGL